MVGVRAGYSLRSGGVSGPPFDSFNLGDHVGDRPGDVAANRAQLAATLGARPVFLNQVHGWSVSELPCADATRADAVWTDRPGQGCCIMVADCLPVLFSDTRGRVVAAAHAGWRGLCGQGGVGVLESLWERLQKRLPQAQWQVWLGPAIGPSSFEVGDEVRQAFVAARADAQVHFKPVQGWAGQWWCDLPALARDRLQTLGIDDIRGNDGSLTWCTHSRPDLYFSHRRDGRSGRMAAVIFLT